MLHAELDDRDSQYEAYAQQLLEEQQYYETQGRNKRMEPLKNQIKKHQESKLPDIVQEQPDIDIIYKLVNEGDLSKFNPTQRVIYYQKICSHLNLDPITRPFEYLELNKKVTLYAKKEAAEQLRKLYKLSIIIVDRSIFDGIYVVTARATLPDGRQDESTGAVSVNGLKGQDKANAMMKAETKAKRRVTLSILGLGFLDESEVETIPDAKKLTETEVAKIHDAKLKDNQLCGSVIEQDDSSPVINNEAQVDIAAIYADYEQNILKADTLQKAQLAFSAGWNHLSSLGEKNERTRLKDVFDKRKKELSNGYQAV